MKLTQFKTEKAADDATALADKLGDAEPYPRASQRRNGKPGAMVDHWWGPPLGDAKGTTWGVRVQALDEETGCARCQRGVDEEVAVVGGPPDGDEELPGCDGPRVDRCAVEARGSFALEKVAAGPLDDVAGEEGNAHGLLLPSARLASTRSSKGSLSLPMIW